MCTFICYILFDVGAVDGRGAKIPGFFSGADFITLDPY